jgi:hypothetical protein
MESDGFSTLMVVVWTRLNACLPRLSDADPTSIVPDGIEGLQGPAKIIFFVPDKALGIADF